MYVSQTKAFSGAVIILSVAYPVTEHRVGSLFLSHKILHVQFRGLHTENRLQLLTSL